MTITRLVRVVGLIVLATLALPVETRAQAQDCALARFFCVDNLNAGLGAAPDILDRSTPRASIETLLYLSERGDWQAAAHLLDLSDVPANLQAVRGPQLIEHLAVVIDRKAAINWDLIRDRPDGIDAGDSSNLAIAGEPRKSLLLWTLDMADQPAAIRLNRIKPANGEPVWLFSRQTVGNIPALFERHGPSEIERILPDFLKRNAGFDFMWWEVIGLPVLLAFALTAGVLTWRLLDWLARSTSQQILHQVFRVARGPAAMGMATGLALMIGSSVFVFSGTINTILVPLAWLGVLASCLWLIVSAVEVILDQYTRFGETDLTKREQAQSRTVATRIAAVRRIFVIAVVLLGAGVFFSQTNFFENLGWTLLGTAGAVTLVLGFAARRVLGNIMASLQIALNQSAKIGDRIVFDDYLCHVERIHFTYVQLRDWDGTRLIVPVEEFVSKQFENWTMQELEMLRIVKLKYAHSADVEALREVFQDVLDELDQDELGDLDSAKVRVAEQDVFGKEVWFAVPCIDPNTSWDIACKAREKIIAASARIGEAENAQMFPEANPAEAA